MTDAVTFLADLRSRGVVLSARDGRLHVSAPKGTLTDADRALIAEWKPLLLAYLAGYGPGAIVALGRREAVIGALRLDDGRVMLELATGEVVPLDDVTLLRSADEMREAWLAIEEAQRILASARYERGTK